MNQLETMQVFLHVADFGSFTKTADLLGLPKGSISTRITQLENHMGTRLLQRTTRRVQLTQDGQLFYERCKDLLLEVADIDGMFTQSPLGIGGRLRVDMSIGMANNFVIPHLPSFLAMHPNIELELSTTDRLVDVIGEGFDCVIRSAPLADSSLVARSLGVLPMVNCASAAYLAQHGTPHDVRDLAAHKLIHYSHTFGARKAVFKYMSLDKNNAVKMPASITVNNSVTLTAACLAGMGIVQVPRVGVAPYLNDGRMVEILPNHRDAPLPVSFIYPNRRNVARRVQVFMDWMLDLMKN